MQRYLSRSCRAISMRMICLERSSNFLTNFIAILITSIIPGRRKQRTVKQLSRSSLKAQLGQQAHLRLPQMNKSRFQNQQRQEVLKLLRRPAENRFRRPVVKRFRRTRLKRTAIPVNRNLPKRLQKQKTRLKQILSRNSNISYTITYDPQGGLWKDGTSDLYEETYSVDTAAMIVTAPKRSGYTFLGWNTGSVTYQPGDTYHEKDANGVLTDATLTAQWRKNSPGSNQDTKPKDDSGKTPNTGDENNLSMWFSLLIATATAAVWLAAIRKRKTNDH